MAITDPAAIKWSNEKARVAADKLVQAYNFAVQVQSEWNSGMSSEFPNDSSIVEDGAHDTATRPDGRTEITGADVNNVMVRAGEIITDYEATSNAKLNTLLAVSVNG
ncbi:hypothetical protein OAG36_00600 [bacterium]|nr:hypothetical protein [bacterium]